LLPIARASMGLAAASRADSDIAAQQVLRMGRLQASV
jgi:hypothetical protein